MNQFSPIGRYHFVVKQIVDTTPPTAFPVLYLDTLNGYVEMHTLIDYFLAFPSRSQTWMRDTARAVGLFYDYVTACRSSNSESRVQLNKFIYSLEHGTLDMAYQKDPTGLYWAPTGLDKAKRLRGYLVAFTDWVFERERANKNQPTKRVLKNEKEELTISLLKTARSILKRSYMEHVKDPLSIAVNLKNTKSSFGYQFEDDPKTYVNSKSETRCFPVELINPLFSFGFIKNPHATNPFEREDITAKMITLLLLFGGLRKSEPFHLWFNDITPTCDFHCHAKIYHPRLAKTNLIGEGTKKREQYLKERQLRPRNQKLNSKSFHAGWKNLAVDKFTYDADIFFLHESSEVLFISLYTLYLSYRSNLMKTYIKEHGHDHPFLFVSSGVDNRTGESFIGAPYSIAQFDKSYRKALDRLEQYLGTRIKKGRDSAMNPHALRHFYGQSLFDLGIDQKVIQKCMRHRSIYAQEAYRNISSQKVRDILSEYSKSEHSE